MIKRFAYIAVASGAGTLGFVYYQKNKEEVKKTVHTNFKALNAFVEKTPFKAPTPAAKPKNQKKAIDLFEDYAQEGLTKIAIFQMCGLLPVVLKKLKPSISYPFWLLGPFIAASFAVDFMFYKNYLNHNTPIDKRWYFASDIMSYGFAFFTFGGMGLSVANYLGFLGGTYLYMLICGNHYNPHLSTAFGAVGAGIAATPFWMFLLKNRMNRMFAITWSLISYIALGYFFNKEFYHHLTVKEDRVGFSSFILNTFKWNTINLSLFGFCTKYTDNIPKFM